MQMTLAKALKYKNRVAERLRKFTDDMSTYNSILAANDAEVDIRRLDEMRLNAMEHLILVKTKIHAASASIRALIFRMGELRSAIGFYKSLSTRHGKAQSNRWTPGDDMVEYKATLRKEDVDRIVAELERQIDQLQDELDAFNHATKIEIEIPDVISHPYAPCASKGGQS